MSETTFTPPPPPVTRTNYSKLNTALWVLFTISGVVAIAETISQVVRSVRYAELTNNMSDSVVDKATSAENAVTAFSLLGLYFAIAIFVLLVIYTFRLVKKVRQSGNSVRMSDGMAIGSWFIPIANAILCYLFYLDIAKADKINRSRGILFLNLWWWPYIVGVGISGRSESLFTVSETIDDALLYSNMAIVGNVIAMIGIVFAVLFFRQLRQFEATLDRPTSLQNN